MPWHISGDHEGCSGWAVVLDSTDKVVGCHPSKAKAQKHLAALNINAKEADMPTEDRAEVREHLEAQMTTTQTRPPRDMLARGIAPGGYEVRSDGDEAPPTLVGHFARFNEWTEIDSAFEGHFLEQIAPGAFAKTFKENRERIRPTFQHGHDPTLGDQVLGPVAELREDVTGAYYEVPLLEGIPPLVMNGLREGLYGSSFRFRVLQDDYVREPDRSEHNPEGIPERTIKEAQVFEFGPVTWPAYSNATAAVRSLTDEFVFGRFTDDAKRLAEIIDYTRSTSTTNEGVEETNLTIAPEDEGPAEVTPEPEGRAEPDKEEAMDEEKKEYPSIREKEDRMATLKAELAALAAEHTGVLSPDAQERWNGKETELRELEMARDAQASREAVLMRFGGVGDPVDDRGKGTLERPDFQVRKLPPDPYDRMTVYKEARSPEEVAAKFHDNALRAVEQTSFPHERAEEGAVKGHIEKLLQNDSRDSEIAKRILITGHPAYRRGFEKSVKAGQFNPPTLTDEERAIMAEGAAATGGAAITFDLDPTIIPTSNGVVNPYRRVCRVVTIAGTNEWRGVTSGAVVAVYEAEGTEVADASPTLAQPAAIVQKAHTFINFSIELQEDWPGLTTELASLIQDAKDTLEATQFTEGVGTTVYPQGILVGATTGGNTATTTVLAAADIYQAEGGLQPRFRPKAQWFASRFLYNKIRQIDTYGSAQMWVPNMIQGLAANETGNTGYNLLGYPANECSAFPASLATTTKLMIFGDPSYFVVVDRVGMNIEFVPLLVGGTANYPTGRRGMYAYWRNTSKVVNAAGFYRLVGL